MNDKELLELAAKAAGIEATGYCAKLGIQYVNGSDDSPFTDYWNPLNDDGDALRLAVKIGLLNGSFVNLFLAIRLEESRINPAMGDEELVRRAFVRSAAEVGKEME